ncbi:uncharacterized protein LOC135075405 [Ostrinia nubilalis]|uniref:uncharacterized protein LOC135075405 n=1 Tax=Ostrinia nubilalis TaxID=29057 RepID=UPI0030823108
MNSFSASAPNTLSLSSSSKLLALEKTLHQSIVNFQEVAKEIEALHLVSEDYKNQFLTQKEKCESKHCSASEALSKVIECKDNIIQSVASAVTRLNETKNFNVIKDIYKILCGDSPITVLKVEPQIVKDERNDTFNFITPKKELDSTTDITDVTMKDESVSEIEGTPTGRTSPIIQSRKMKNGCVSSSSDHRDKKKCPDSWSTPDSKAMKLTFPPNSKRGKWRQGRLSVVTVKSNSVVDLTSSPELMAMNKSSQPETIVQALVKKESTDNDDTILPSPTSGPNNYPSLLKNPIKSESFKRPLCLKNKSEDKINKCNVENSPKKKSTKRQEEPDESINLLKPARFMKMLDENSPIKVQMDDETHCEIPSSLSILEHHVLASKDAGEALKAVR